MGTAERGRRPDELFRAVAPARVVDTRGGLGGTTLNPGDTLTFTPGGKGTIPSSGATSVVFNLTSDRAAGLGFLTAYPCDVARPTASNVNIGYSVWVANQVTVPVAADGTVCIYASNKTDVIIDLNGWYGAVADDGLHPLTPVRVVDTRNGIGAPKAKVAPDTTMVFSPLGTGGVPSSGVSAVVFNLTADGGVTNGYVLAYPCDQPLPYVSNVNFDSIFAAANAVTVPLAADGTICLRTSAATDLLIDIQGWFSACRSSAAPGPRVRPVVHAADEPGAPGGLRAADGLGCTFLLSGRGKHETRDARSRARSDLGAGARCLGVRRRRR